ncbi:MAG TPA: DEAD/DEAH box helicase, partial [Burkholderiaceae bacterium]|nr:DEAD/DEAH box helicase [Burkholderiaceae bacterium]
MTAISDQPGHQASRYARVALDLPMAQLGAAWFDYRLPSGQTAIGPGSWVIVPWGRGRKVGLVFELADQSELAHERIRPIDVPLAGAPPAPMEWLRLVRFAAEYYHRGAGEVALPAVPKLLRTPPSARARGSVFERARRRFEAVAGRQGAGTPDSGLPVADEPGRFSLADSDSREPSPAQRDALAALSLAGGFSVNLLHGVTGSGKTEVYLQWLSAFLAGDEQAQVLLLVPEIALTPQLAGQLASRFPDERVAVLHSDLADGDRAAHWLAAVDGRARVVVGTRLAVLAPLPRLAAIVVDEEHDPSYKQQEGVRYSARDLAIVAASQRGIPIVLGSATPSL